MRIISVSLGDFRAFPGPDAFVFDLGAEGRNLLLYGENGSGKSSLFGAFQELFNLDPGARSFRAFKNAFSGNETQSHINGAVLLDLEDGSRLEWSYLGERPVDRALVADAALRKAFLGYRSLLRTSFVEGPIEERLFHLAAEVLLRSVPVTLPGQPERTLGIYWDEVKDSRPKHRYPRMLQIAAAAADQFNAAFRAILPDVEREFRRLLNYFGDPALEVELDFSGLLFSKADKDFLNQRLNLLVKFRGLEIGNHIQFLNEARLSALALALYFAAARLGSPRPPPGVDSPLKLLVLDDVLIGLDMAHRLPVLKLVQTEFVKEDWQIFLFTFDRAWYEVAKQHLNDGKWTFAELYAARVGGHEQPILLRDGDHLDRALDFLSRGEVKAAAVHVRTEFELVLKRACQGLRIPVRYELDPRKLAASELWDAFKSAEFEFQPAVAYAFNAKGHPHSWQPKKRTVRYIPPRLVSRIEHSVSWVLNPLSHSQIVDRYRNEIEDAVFAVDELRSLVNKALQGELHPLAEQRELLLRILSVRMIMVTA